MRRYRIQHRTTGADDAAPWTTMPALEVCGEHVEISGLEPGTVVDVRIREIGPDGEEGPLLEILGHEVAAAAPAPAVHEVTVEGGCLHWRAPADPRVVAGFMVRYGQGETRHWETLTPAHEGVWPGPPLPLCGVPTGVVTFGVVAVGPSGAASAPGFTVVDRGAFDQRAAVVLWTQDHAALGWPGARPSASIDAGVLKAPTDSDPSYGGAETVALYGDYGDDVEYGADTDDEAYGPDEAIDEGPYGPDDPAAEYGGDVYAELVYQPRIVVPFFDPTRAAVLTLAPEIGAGGAWRVEYRRNATDAYGPDEDLEYGAQLEDSEAEEPYGPEAGAAWRPWPGSVPAEPGVYELRLTIAGGAVRGQLDEFVVAVSAAA